MRRTPKILIVDDDEFFCRMLSLKLRRTFPYACVSMRTDAAAHTGYDVYIIDNDFDGICQGAKIAETLSKSAPKALIAMMSGSLDQQTLMRLVNCQASGVFDKGEEQDIERLTALIDAHFASLQLAETQAQAAGSTLGELTRFIEGWNERLNKQSQSAI